MILGLWLLLIILGFFFHKSKRLSYVQMTFIILVMGLSSGTADYYTYNMIYQSIIRGGTALFSDNWLFNLFYYVFGVFTSYQFVIFMTAMIGMYLVYKSIIYYTDSISLVLSLYMIAPFTIDATQQKNFLAMAIWLYFSRFLYQAYCSENNRIKNILKYCIGVILAMGVHVSFALAFLFVIVVFLDLKKMLILVITFNLAVFWGLINIYDKVIEFIGENYESNSLFEFIYSKYIAYSISFDMNSTVLRIKIMAVFYILLLLCYLLVKIFKKEKFYTESYKLVYFMMILNLITIMFLPLMFFSMEFYRIQRNLLVIDFAALGTFMFSPVNHHYKLSLNSFLIGIATILPAFYYLLSDTLFWNYDTVFAPLFKLLKS